MPSSSSAMLTSGSLVKSKDRIPKSLDKAMDKRIPSSNGHAAPGISIRNGPVDDIGVVDDAHQTNGVANGKRKSRASIVSSKSYRDFSSSDDDDDKPLVRTSFLPVSHSRLSILQY
jgi:DNA topoisomerase-1